MLNFYETIRNYCYQKYKKFRILEYICQFIVVLAQEN